ncbi:hypothetical protein [Streptomyces sp. TS71-3]|uniref:hypothetical protein n=1 Tax=Streptomyces sp. TS71-3 TaxID=2733862 RepID=UPI001B1BFE25|nr:hypothetical protein [Streptomyces sp. TS71-3]GHJ41599.1 hypothetical protein Sm713_72080 [Streptomyces sp. TS71-3]
MVGTPTVDSRRDLTFAEHATVRRAEERLTKECMRAKGFPYWAEPVHDVPDLLSHGYVLTDVHWAKTYGYGRKLDEQARKERLADKNVAFAKSLPKSDVLRYNAALYGTPSHGLVTVDLPTGGTVRTTQDGCQAETTRRLYGDLPTWFRAEETATNLTALYAPAIVKDPRLRKALSAWSACMSAKGHPFTDPPEIRRERPALTAGLGAAEAQALEVELAVAEATCATTTPLERTARALEREYRAKRLGRYRDAIATYQRMSHAALTRATALLNRVPSAP